MSALDKHKLHYEDLPPKQHKITRKGGKDIKMSKASKVETPSKDYSPTKMEVFKTVVIWMLITAIVAFISGMQFQKNYNATIDKAVQSAVSAQKVETPSPKQ